METKVVISLPSYNEADSIGFVTEQADNVVMFDPQVCVLLNVDSGSTDGTSQAFLSVPTRCRKQVINTGRDEHGKGRNILALFQWAHKMKADFIVTIDTDLKTIESDWASRLLAPVVSRECDYVAPLYTRNRFEGSTTNHFAFPVILGFFGAAVRQPIGGEFAMNGRVVDYFLRQHLSEDVQKYGIDIWMTMHALGGRFRVGEVFLGRKFHKPSFPKIMTMFPQISQTAFEVLRLYSGKKNNQYVQFRPHRSSGIDQVSIFPHKDEIPLLLTNAAEAFTQEEEKYRRILGDYFSLVKKLLENNKPEFSAENWAMVLKCFIAQALASETDPSLFRYLGHLLAQIFIWRAAAFWLEAECISADEAESRILLQAKDICQAISRLVN